ncbi:SET domain-containing protein 9 [Quillaja saponaria]|uniref:SET domain-containing protein 9 n=1 Tax=Quillaja saponaria TaxID=32244 RepID=A0AAD7P5H1_QUISA|nr:SET domain-containing protein 9 [Quillaja saponaria]
MPNHWGSGNEMREVWNGLDVPEISSSNEDFEKGSDRFWKLLSKPLEGSKAGKSGDVLERRNPLALGHFANHPAKEMAPNVMICPYDFPLPEKDMRPYIPNILFGNAEVTMKRFGSFWFKSGGSNNSELNIPILKTLVLVATRALHDEELLLNYRLSNSKRRPAWYTPVDEEEERRRWS